ARRPLPASARRGERLLNVNGDTEVTSKPTSQAGAPRDPRAPNPRRVAAGRRNRALREGLTEAGRRRLREAALRQRAWPESRSPLPASERRGKTMLNVNGDTEVTSKPTRQAGAPRDPRAPNPRRVAAGRRNRALREGLTEAGRRRLRETALRHRPWPYSTGPK